MKACLIFVASVGWAGILAADCRAQDHDSSQLTREEWQAQVQAARERIELARRQHRSFVPRALSQDEIAEVASKRVMDDDSLQPGDIVSTTHGLFRFRGGRTPDDFVRIR